MSLIESIPTNKILVTGANGYLGTWIIHDLLNDGFSVRGTVRSEEKGAWVASKFASYGDRFEWVTIDDITMEGGFDEAVKDVAGVIHVASPLSPPGPDPDYLIKPAVEGTLGILTSVLNHGKLVKRVVITSSCGAIAGDSKDSTSRWDESHWGDVWVEKTREEGFEAPHMTKYRASKTLAERAAWTFYEENRNVITWDLVALNPPFILGGSLLDTNEPRNLTSSLHGLYHNLFVSQRALKVGNIPFSYVHVKDASHVHVRALNTPAATGQRIIVSAGASTWGKARNLVGELYPDLVQKGLLPTIIAEHSNTVEETYRNEKSKVIFGIEYRGFIECIKDSVEDWRKRGFFDAT